MTLRRLLRRLLGQAPGHHVQREQILERVETLGFRVEDISGWHDGKYAVRRYRLIDSDGTVLDNAGSGYASSSEVYRAAKAARQQPE